jgi:uncharacterized protein (DUF302 family)
VTSPAWFIAALIVSATPVAGPQEAGALAEAESTAPMGMVIKDSAHSVGITVERLKAGLDKRGIALIATVDHRENAASVKKNLRPTTLLIFGNPKLGTPLMQEAPSLALDLPMKVAVWRDEKSKKVQVAYTDPGYLAQKHGIAVQIKLIERMKKALDKLTNEATAKK